MDAKQTNFGPFHLDIRQRILRRDGISVELGGRAPDILCTMASYHGDLVAKDVLIAAVWPGQIVEENTLRSQV